MSGNIKVSVGVPATALVPTFLSLAEALKDTSLLVKYLDKSSLIALLETCRGVRSMVYDDAMSSILLMAVVHGDEKIARNMLTKLPITNLLTVKSATTKDLSGKEIKGLTALQAAICAGDVEMANMIKTVLLEEQPLNGKRRLSFDPELEIQRQFKEIYPEGIDAVETVQKAAAEAFKDSTLMEIFNAINTAINTHLDRELMDPDQDIIATQVDLKFKQKKPRLISRNSQLNKALHKFREQVAELSNQDQKFNPFYLLAAYELYFDRNNFQVQNNKRMLLWVQVVGYIQRYLPACYLQAFARGINDIVNKGAKLERTFEFYRWKGYQIKEVVGDSNRLGYFWAAQSSGAASKDWVRNQSDQDYCPRCWKDLLQIKKTGLENLCSQRLSSTSSNVTFRPGAQ